MRPGKGTLWLLGYELLLFFIVKSLVIPSIQYVLMIYYYYYIFCLSVFSFLLIILDQKIDDISVFV